MLRGVKFYALKGRDLMAVRKLAKLQEFEWKTTGA